jgi:lipoate-protein ligase A
MKIERYTFDEDIIEVTKQAGSPGLKVYIPRETCVVIGRGSDPDKEVRTEKCLEDNIPIFKRDGGGSAVVLDPGNVIVSLTLPVDGIGNNNRYFRLISDWLIKAMSKMGLENVKCQGYSDLTVNEKKISGSCIHRTKGTLYYSASILIDADISLFEKYLKHPPREPDYRRNRPHEEFVTTVNSVYKKYTAVGFKEKIWQFLTLDDLNSRLMN